MTHYPLLVIDFVAGGHHPSYLRHLVRFGLNDRQLNIKFLLPRELYDSVNSALSKEESAFFTPRVRVLEEEAAWLRIGRWTRNKTLARWLYVEYLNLSEGKERRLLFLFLETVIYQLALTPIPRFNMSGLMFRPTFYYVHKRMLASGFGSRAIFSLKWSVAYLMAMRPGIHRVFVLDPLAEEYTLSRWRTKKFKFVPEPLELVSRPPLPEGGYGAMTDRPIILLIAGALHPRKGIHLTVNALSKSSEETRRNVRLLVIGKPEDGFANYVAQNVTRLKEMGVEVDSNPRLFSDHEIDERIAQSDVVLTPYVGFKGSSSIVARAAYFGKPVISTNEGLLGHLVLRHKLGEAMDVEDAETFSKCLDRIVSTGRVSGFDPVSARSFASGCDPVDFAKSLIGDSRSSA